VTAAELAAAPSGVAAPADEPDDDLTPCPRCRETGIDPADFGECVTCAGLKYLTTVKEDAC
jgi:hypothetical protein